MSLFFIVHSWIPSGQTLYSYITNIFLGIQPGQGKYRVAMERLAKIEMKLWKENKIQRMWEFRGRGCCTQRPTEKRD